jgi:DNA-binding transcriptional LysR family regulator
MNITLNQLRAFERIVRLGSFSGAARSCGLTQPSISQRIHELETALDTSLFLRNGPRIKPTAEAHALLAYADRVLETEIEMRERFRSRDPLRGLLRIGVSENFALICMAEMFRRLESAIRRSRPRSSSATRAP